MKNGDQIEYQNRQDHSWKKARMVGETSNGDFVVECPLRGIITREKHEVRMPKQKVTRWVNVYLEDKEKFCGGKLFDTEEAAKFASAFKPQHIATVPVTWEE